MYNITIQITIILIFWNHDLKHGCQNYQVAEACVITLKKKHIRSLANSSVDDSSDFPLGCCWLQSVHLGCESRADHVVPFGSPILFPPVFLIFPPVQRRFTRNTWLASLSDISCGTQTQNIETSRFDEEKYCTEVYTHCGQIVHK